MHEVLSGFSVCMAAKPAKQLRACYWLVRLGAQHNTCTVKPGSGSSTVC